jgi:hypothetical protein
VISVGIYGDSFADPYNPRLRNQAWMFHLSGYAPTIYSLNGSSMFYSYQKFLDNHHKHEKNIFCVTDCKRWPENVMINKHGKEKGFGTFKAIDEFLKDDNAKQGWDQIFLLTKIKILRELYFYFDNDYLSVFQQLMIKHIKEIRPDTLIISCFWSNNENKKIIENSAGDNSFALVNYSFIMLSSILYKTPHIPMIGGQTYSDSDAKRHDPLWNTMNITEKNLICHFSKEMNQIVAKDVTDALETGIWDPKPPLFVPHEKDLSFYYEV